MDERGLMHAFSGKNNCSVRTQLSKKIVDKTISVFKKVQVPKKQKRKFKERKKKLGRLMNVTATKDGISKDKLEKRQYYFTEKTKKQFKKDNSEIFESFTSYKIKTIFPKNIINNTAGVRMMESKIVPIFILVPRKQALCNMGSPHTDVNSLFVLLNKYNNKKARGMKRTGISSHYATLGAHCRRFGKGMSLTNVSTDCQVEYEHVTKKMLGRVKFFAKSYLPVPLMSLIKEVKKTVKDNVSLQVNDVDFSSIWASLASSCNYMSPAHTDKDGFISCLLCSHVPKETPVNQKFCYKKKMDIAYYFCFPEWGRFVAIRPGDVLFFNPLHFHCLSERTSAYHDEKVYVTSFYLKTSQIGLNDNSIDIDNILYEKICLDE